MPPKQNRVCTDGEEISNQLREIHRVSEHRRQRAVGMAQVDGNKIYDFRDHKKVRQERYQKVLKNILRILKNNCGLFDTNLI